MAQGDADRSRKYATQLVEEARSRGESRITLRVGDIHDHLGMKLAHANVCQALEGREFHEQSKVKLIDYCGAPSRRSSNSYFEFEILHPTDTPLGVESKENIIEKLTERIDELTQDEFESIVRAYAKAKGFSNVELSFTLRFRE